MKWKTFIILHLFESSLPVTAHSWWVMTHHVTHVWAAYDMLNSETQWSIDFKLKIKLKCSWNGPYDFSSQCSCRMVPLVIVRCSWQYDTNYLNSFYFITIQIKCLQWFATDSILRICVLRFTTIKMLLPRSIILFVCLCSAANSDDSFLPMHGNHRSRRQSSFAIVNVSSLRPSEILTLIMRSFLLWSSFRRESLRTARQGTYLST